MNLCSSIFTTIVITGFVWALVLLQPVLASTKQAAPSVANQKNQLIVKTKSKTSEVSQHKKVEKTDELWKAFYEKSTIDGQLSTLTDSVIVLYQNFNNDFSKAEITIGYVSEGNLVINAENMLLSTNKAMMALEKGWHDDKVITDTWSAIDWNKKVIAVVETYYLNNQRLSEASQVYVHYEK